MTEQHDEPVTWECFQDASYYDMWCVRPVKSRAFGEGFHLMRGEEAMGLCEMLNTRPMPSSDMVEAMARAICSADPEIRMGDAERVVQQRVAAEWRNYLPAALAAATVITEAMAAKDAQLAELRVEIEAVSAALGSAEG